MHAFRAAVETQDHAAMVATLSPDVEFHSPVAFTPFVGRDAAAGVLAGVMSTFTDFSYTDEVEQDGLTLLMFRAKVGDKAVQGMDIMRAGDDGLITEFTVMLRPLSAIVAMGEAMKPKVEGLAKGAKPST